MSSTTLSATFSALKSEIQAVKTQLTSRTISPLAPFAVLDLELKALENERELPLKSSANQGMTQKAVGVFAALVRCVKISKLLVT